MDLKSHIRNIPDFPKPGIMFRDITPLLSHPEAFKATMDQMAELARSHEVTKVVGIEARGFAFAGPLAYLLGAGCTMVRKPGKLPFDRLSKAYDLEYGQNTIEIHADAIEPGERVLLVDDLLATGGTMDACVHLVQELKAEVAQIQFLVELTFLKGRERFSGHDVRSLIQYADENP